jgi:hypothetical protein
LKVTADDANLPVAWCGITWVKSEAGGGPPDPLAANQRRSGQGACVCPTNHVKVNNSSTGRYEIWRYGVSLRLDRIVTYATYSGRNLLWINPNGAGLIQSHYGHVFKGISATSTYVFTAGGGWPGSPAKTIGPPTWTGATPGDPGGNITLLDGFFTPALSFTAGGALYEWRRGDLWP